MSVIHIEETTLDDIVPIHNTITEFETQTLEHFTNRTRNSTTLTLIAYVNDEPAGYMVSYQRDDDGSFYCWMAGVNPNFRRKGVLAGLMGHTIKWAKQEGYSKLKIKTRNNRRNMIHFLIKNNFNVTHVEQKEDIRENRIHLEILI